VSFLRQRNSKRFGYKLRSRREQLGNRNDDFESKWQESRLSTKGKGFKLRSLPVLIVLFIMVLILMYVLNSYQ
jgi:hypothetical protein